MYKNGIFLALLFCLSIATLQGSKKTNLRPEAPVGGVKLDDEDKRKFDYFFLESLRLKENGQYDRAFDLLLHCNRIDSTSAPVMFEMAFYYKKMKKNKAAVAALQKAVALDKSNYWYNMTLADQCGSMHLFATAIETYENMIPSYPEKPELNYELASLYAQNGETEKAVKSLNKLEESIGVNETVSMEKFKLYRDAGNEKAAFAEIEQLIKKYPYEMKYVVGLGDLYLDAGKPKEAYMYYQKALELEPDNSYLAVSLANYYEAVGDKESAKVQMKSVLVNPKIEIEDKIGYLSHYLQYNVKDSTDLPQAEELFVQLLNEYPQEPDLHTMYGRLLLSQQKPDQAKAQFQIVTELAPDNKDNWIQLVSLDGQSGQYKEMTETCNKALEVFPEFPEIYFYQGVGYSQLDDYESALKSFETGVIYIPKDNVRMISDFYGQIGDIDYKLDRKDEAFAAYEKALSYNDQNIGVLNNYAYFLSLEKKDLDKAERMSGICVKLQPDNSTYLDTYAWVFFMEGNYTLAKFYLNSAMQNGGDTNEEILEHYGDTLYKSGETDEALQYWQKALEKGSESKTLRKKIETKAYVEEE
ncbi:MAG: tetratricopeptide repeat protein [Candidatus Azobacteroides sp.]|nr:tetratricopeptide repeat protein [Candidatus Azobacteroides sp.]